MPNILPLRYKSMVCVENTMKLHFEFTELNFSAMYLMVTGFMQSNWLGPTSADTNVLFRYCLHEGKSIGFPWIIISIVVLSGSK